MLRPAALILVIGASLLFVQCGGSNNTPATTGTTNPSPTPGSTPNPSPNPSATPDAYLATVICCLVSRTPVGVGQVTVDSTANNGAGIWPSAGTGSGVTMLLEFCPYGQSGKNCLKVATYTAGGVGAPPVNFTFPSKGTFAGEFIAYANGDLTDPEVYTTSGASSALNFRSAMLPAGSITGGIGQATGSASGSGVLTATGTIAHLVLTGTLPNHGFQVSVCWLDSAHCRAMSNISTDSQGNANADVGTLQNQDNDMFLVSDSSGVQFISAFRAQ